ncbi:MULTISPECIES: hypothetical protein [Henriciella]|jgi:ATP/maltotriose-dependent transcriptional regulator MalT|uniref:Flagellar protein FlgN n=1 Tax=Henriciella pelagia TaxID=1977912 RepID=A0ABQ1JUI8_9PROT|nr:hypothetical protein [Henriciella pelagia]GGB75870.1 hypothetical protein GCM10011503_25760 [Henriciella pelagia]
MSTPEAAGNILDHLQSVLEAEHQALLAGQAGTAASLLEQKMKAMSAFDTLLQQPELIRALPDYSARMERIISLASENAGHFNAVRNGVNSAISRLGSSAGNSYVGAYQANGAQTAFTKAVGGYEKKA